MQLGFSDPFLSYMDIYLLSAPIMMAMARSPRAGAILLATTLIAVAAYRAEISPVICGLLPPLALLALMLARQWPRRSVALNALLQQVEEQAEAKPDNRPPQKKSPTW